MKTYLLITCSAIGLFGSSCSFIDTKSKIKAAYEQGRIHGAADATKHNYWNQPVQIPDPNAAAYATATPIVVPEHTAPDGVIIETHPALIDATTAQ